MLADGDGVADIDPAADGDHGVGIEAAVGTHGELPAGPAVANPAHRFTQEVGGAASGVGNQHVAGAGGDGQQRVIAPLAGIAVVACALLGQSVGLADGGVQVNGQGPVAGSRPGLPSPGQQLAAHPVELTDVAPCAGRCPGWMFTVPPRVLAVPPVRNTSASSMQSASADATSVHLVARVRRPGRGAAGRVRAGRGAAPGWPEGAARHWPPSGGREGDLDPVSIYWVLLFQGRFFATKPLSQKHRSGFRTLTRRPLVDSGLVSTLNLCTACAPSWTFLQISC